MSKNPITPETVTKVGLIIDLAYAVAVGVKRIVSLFKRKRKLDETKTEQPVQE